MNRPRKNAIIMALLFALTLTGCAMMTNPYKDMSADQIAAAVKDKNLTAWCFIVNTPYGKAIVSILNLDKQVLPPGSAVTMDDACKISVTTGPAK